MQGKMMYNISMEDYIKETIKRINKNLDKQEEIRKKLSTFKKGHLIIKKRNGIGYYYFEYRDNNKVKTDYIGRVNTGEIEKYLKQQDQKILLKDELGELIIEETKLKNILKALGINNYRNVYTFYEIKRIIKPYLKKYSIEKAFLFGSYAKGTANKKSDIDFVFSKPKNNKIEEFEEKIKKAFGKEIDFIYSGETLQKQFIDGIKKEMIQIK